MERCSTTRSRVCAVSTSRNCRPDGTRHSGGGQHRSRSEHRLVVGIGRRIGREGLRTYRAETCNETRNPLEISRRGIFAIGDVHSGSIKRVAAAVGEGAQVVATLHATLASPESKIPGEAAARD